MPRFFTNIMKSFKGALLNSLILVTVVTAVTFLLVLLVYFRCTKFLKYYMGFSAFLVLGFMGGEISLFLIEHFDFGVDCVTFLLALVNLTVVGVLAVIMSIMAIFVTQGYLVLIGVLSAYWFTQLPEWTTWVLLVAMSLYDLAVVLLSGGPLRLLVELTISQDKDIPTLVYEARPVSYTESAPASGSVQRTLWRERMDFDLDHNESLNCTPNANLDANLDRALRTYLSIASAQNLRSLVNAEEGQLSGGDSELSAPLIEPRLSMQMYLGQDGATSENLALEGIGLASSGAIKLGLGDFIFYSVLVGRAAMYDFMTVYACYHEIIAGLGITLILLAFYQKVLPALPVSVMLGVLFYLLTLFVLEAFVVQCSVNLVMF